MDWLRLSTYSVGSLTTTILLGAITGYLLSLKGKTRDTWYLTGHLGALFVLLLSYTLRYTVFSPAALATGQMSNLIVFGVVCLIQFGYHYGGNHHRLESRIALAVSLATAAVSWGSLFWEPDLPAVYAFKSHYFTYEFGPRVSIVTLVGFVWAIVVLLRKTIRSSRTVKDSGVLAALLRPAGRTAFSTRSFALLTVATAILAVLYMLYQTGVISRSAHALMFNTGSLLICLGIFIVYVNNASQPTSVMAKLVGVPLAMILVTFGITASALMPVIHGTLSDRYRSELDQVWGVLRSGDMSRLSPDVAFLSNEFESVSGGASPAEGVYGPLTERRGFTPRFTYRDLYDTGSFSFYYTVNYDGKVYRMGFPYRGYRLAVHQFNSKLALIVLAATLLVVLGFPLAYRSGLLQPLRSLLHAVDQITSGNYRMSLPEYAGDEIGQLARGYNRMVESLRNAEGNFKALADNANDAILILSSDGRVLYANPRAVDISGYSAGEILRKHFLEFVHPEEREAVAGRFRARMDGLPGPRAYETRIVRRDGQSISAEVTGARTAWANAAADVVVIRDVTERKRAEELLHMQQQQLLQTDKLTSLGALVAGVAHEVNNPNQVVALNSRFLSEGLPRLLSLVESGEEVDDSIRLAGVPYGEFGEAARTALSEIEESTKRIGHIVAELKRFVQGGADRKMEPTDVNEVVNTVVSLSRYHISRATRSFTVDLGYEVPHVSADPIGLEQVVLNLLQNAWQALEDPSHAIKVSTRHDEKARMVLIEVRDEGVGVPEEHLPRITDPFFTTRSESGGTGLGLSVSDRIVRGFGGRLEFISRVGYGTTARVRLPAIAH